VTAVQLSRGKAEAQLLLEITLLLQDLGRLAADLLLFYTREFSYVALAPELTTGSSIMPQKRNPDALELIRGRSATGLACLVEVLGISSRLPSGYHRDLQLIKAPLFRGIDVATQVLGLVPVVLEGLTFRPERIRLDADIHATARANALAVEQGLPFREAYRITAKTS
jgi:argininosuccinate lyase